MRQVNIHQAKTHLSRLLARVQRGEEIIIAKADVPIARFVPINSRPATRAPGSARGKIAMTDDFDAPLVGDPFDRLLVVQAQMEDLPIVTADAMIGNYPVTTIW